ncbi:MAG: hypothetical protein OXG85_06700 [Chloroflexi bacterium]|nr:hypothetical protein [Chloroflexota bacterium]
MHRAIALLLVLFHLLYAASAQTTEAELALEHASTVRTAAWSPDESRILTAEGNGTIHVWSAENGERLLRYNEDGNSATHAQWVGAGASILSADEKGKVFLHDASDGSLLHSWKLTGIPIALELNEAETLALVFTDAGVGAVLSLADGATAGSFGLEGAIGGADWSADESLARAWTESGRIHVWDVATGEKFDYSLPQRSMLLGLDWSADETRLLAWFTNGAAQVYETDGRSVHGRAVSGVRHRSFVKRAIWSLDESMVMSWAGDDTVQIWAVDGAASQRVFRHDDWVIGARWDDREERVLSWSHIYLYLWDDDETPRRFRHRNLVNGAVWNRAATQILSWSWDGTARVWRV